MKNYSINNSSRDITGRIAKLFLPYERGYREERHSHKTCHWGDFHKKTNFKMSTPRGKKLEKQGVKVKGAR